MYEESVPVRESPMRRAFAQDFTSAYQMLPNLLMFAFFSILSEALFSAGLPKRATIARCIQRLFD